ncbi:MAG: mercuric reductase [Planctomycetota bacterium]|nr:mercuric reductase [Planctomycetota bacterium]
MPVTLLPQDTHNQALVDHVHPADWQNPTPQSRYHLVVIGGGTAGLVSAAGAAGLGAKVALIERHLLGGDCLNTGCVPSKAIIRSAKAAHEARNAGAFGVPAATPARADFGMVMEQMRALRSGIAHHDSAQRFKDLGVDVFLGDATFTGPDTIQVDGETLRFKKAVIATGARASVPPIPGIEEVDYLTNEALWSLTELPDRLLVVGAGPIGVEMAQSFARLGSEVTLVDMADRVMPRESEDASRIVGRALERDGVRLLLGSTDLAFEQKDGAARATLTSGGAAHEVLADTVLLAAGRKPNVEGMGLEAAGVRYDARAGIEVDDALRSSNKRIFACGDVAGRFQFTHTADAEARIVIRNALFGILPKQKASSLVVPWVTYSDPEVAHVGVNPGEGVDVDTFRVELDTVDRAILDRDTDGFLEVHLAKGSDTIVGATMVSRHAGETISELTTAMVHKIGLGKLASVIHPYPTQAEAIKKAADAYNRTRLTPFAAKLLRFLMGKA